MTLDDIEKLSADLLAYSQRFGIVAEVHNGAVTERQLVDLARAVLAMLPLCRDAIRLHDRAEKCVDRPYMGCAMDHSSVESALYEGVDALRAALESTDA